ncbi:MAG: YitT family protein [Thermoplasmata archaeon]|jgi:hypothetical protein|nr:YitT family protein [Thermoplasmata archaeon]
MDPGLLKRVTMFVIGLFVMTLGIAVSTKADIGTTSISSIPFVVSLASGIDLYITTLILNIILIAIQVLVLGKGFRLFNLLQIPTALIFSLFTKVTVDLVESWYPSSYLECWVYSVASVLILGTGVALVVNSRTTMVPGEGAVLALSVRTKVPFSRMKIIFDVTNITIAALISLAVFGGFEGVREGTVFAAVSIGVVVRYATKVIKKVFPDPENDIS